ncbi:unnamed protein product [Bursaphelenchus xylophilus]|uniref:(pine wood nematode) hypothetical protein n=1 Tax=Bursaphelenchus xylophilus TaxID=6326 RepID=A0A1I7S2G7_BURXY|nr:unnamed protein product [Bursaphelenchus xylophilus]CAG9114565.1 unnamed protein product [Bursaphelenchus xylophilus]
MKQLVDHVDPANAHSDALGERLIVVQTSATTHEKEFPSLILESRFESGTSSVYETGLDFVNRLLRR